MCFVYELISKFFASVDNYFYLVVSLTKSLKFQQDLVLEFALPSLDSYISRTEN